MTGVKAGIAINRVTVESTSMSRATTQRASRLWGKQENVLGALYGNQQVQIINTFQAQICTSERLLADVLGTGQSPAEHPVSGSGPCPPRQVPQAGPPSVQTAKGPETNGLVLGEAAVEEAAVAEGPSVCQLHQDNLRNTNVVRNELSWQVVLSQIAKPPAVRIEHERINHLMDEKKRSNCLRGLRILLHKLIKSHDGHGRRSRLIETLDTG